MVCDLSPPGNTTTGKVLEDMVIPALRRGGYQYHTQVPIGTRPSGKPQRVDLVAEKGGRVILISMKWQQRDGTAEQKVPYEVICLNLALRTNPGSYAGAYLVLGGRDKTPGHEGWTLRNFYVSGGLQRYMANMERITIVSLEDFIAKANAGDL